MSLRSCITALVVVGLGFGLAACGEGEPADDFVDFPDGKADSITPQGDLGYLVVKLPDDLPANVASLGRLKYRDVDIEFDVKYRLKKGPGILVLGNLYDGSVTIEAKKTLAYVLPTVIVKWDPARHEVDVGPQAAFTLTNKYNSGGFNQALDGREPSLPKAFPLVAGSYTAQLTPVILSLTVFNYTTKRLDLKMGQRVTINVDEDVRSFVTFEPPVREAGAPSGFTGCATYQTRDGVTRTADCQYNQHFVVWAKGTPSGLYEPPLPGALDPDQSLGFYSFYHFTLEPGNPVTVRMFPLTQWEGTGLDLYKYVVNNTHIYLRPAKGKSTIEGQHLDVFNAEVEEDGRIKEYPATYSIQLADKSMVTPIAATVPRGDRHGNFFVKAKSSWFETPSGLDLPPGEYTVTVKFTTELGNMQRVYKCELVTPSVAGQERCQLISES